MNEPNPYAPPSVHDPDRKLSPWAFLPLLPLALLAGESVGWVESLIGLFSLGGF